MLAAIKRVHCEFSVWYYMHVMCSCSEGLTIAVHTQIITKVVLPIVINCNQLEWVALVDYIADSMKHQHAHR